MTVRLSMEEGIGRLVLSDPPLNLLTRSTLERVREGLGELAGRSDLRVLFLGSEGPHFSAGASVPEHLPPEHDAMIPEFGDTILQVAAFPLPVVAAVRGRCLGGGFELALAADLVLAGEGAVLGLPEIQLGVFPPAACALLPERVPRGALAALLFTGDPLGAREAAQAGLVHRVVPDPEVDAAALSLAARIARHSAAALRAARSAWLRPRRELWARRLRDAEGVYLADLMTTHDALEGLRAFQEKRPPRWSHQ